MKISVIIPTYNRRDILARTLPSILGQEYPSDEYEVIVVIDGSTDGTRELLEAVKSNCALRIVEQPNRGISAARNTGLKTARGDLVLFLDDDLICDCRLIKEHTMAHAQGPGRVVSGPVLISSDSAKNLATDCAEEDTRRYVQRINGQTDPRWPEDAIVFANSSLERAVALAAGGFDERFFFALEEVDLGLRLWKSGKSFAFCSSALTHQIYVKTASQLVQSDGPWYGRNGVLLCRKHQDYRPYAQLSALVGGPRWKRNARRLMLRWPRSSDAMISLLLFISEQTRSVASFRRAGMRLLALRRSIAVLRGAVESAGSMRALQSEFGVRLPTLMYHRIGPKLSGTYRELTLSPKRFEDQIRWLSKLGYIGVSPSDWVKWYKTGTALPPKSVLITMDDGYADLGDYALPILRRYGFKAVVYLVTSCIGGHNTWDRTIGSAAIPLMSADQIRYWAANGIEFGCHTRTHPDLTTITGPELDREIVGSRDDLQTLLGSPPVSFAFPYGMYNKESIDCAKSAFDLLATCDEGMNELHGDPRMLKRTMVLPGDSLLDVTFRVALGWSPIERARASLQLRSRLKRLFGMKIDSAPYPLS